MLADRSDAVHDPAIAFPPVYPGRHVSTRAHACNERAKAAFGVGQVMQHANRKRISVNRAHRRLIEVGLYDVHVAEMPRIREGCFYGYTQIEGDDVFRADLAGQRAMASFATAAFEHD